MPSGGTDLEAVNEGDGSSRVGSQQSSQVEEPTGGVVVIVVMWWCDHCHYAAATAVTGQRWRQWVVVTRMILGSERKGCWGRG